MDPEGFKRVRELFDGALERSADERHAFLKDACGSDQDLLEQVERLLDFAEREDDQVRASEKAAVPTCRLPTHDCISDWVERAASSGSRSAGPAAKLSNCAT